MPLSSSQVCLAQPPKKVRPREVPLMIFNESSEERMAATQRQASHATPRQRQRQRQHQERAKKTVNSKKKKEKIPIDLVHSKKQPHEVSVIVSLDTDFEENSPFINCYNEETIFILRETSNACVPNPVLVRARRQQYEALRKFQDTWAAKCP
jgi:hypothetical protein